MLAKNFRLHKRSDFDQILRSKYKFYSPNLVLKFVKSSSIENAFAVVISTKISKKAVQRNKIRRQVYEIIRLHFGKIKKSYQIVFFAKPGILNLKYQEIEKEVLGLLSKARLIGN